MKVLSKGNKAEVKRIRCDHCGAELEIESSDEYVGAWGLPCVKCPECDKEVFVADARMVAPILNQTFVDYGAKHGAAHVEDERVQTMINKVYQRLTEGATGDYFCSTTGDVLVFGARTDDEITVYVTRDWKEDITCLC